MQYSQLYSNTFILDYDNLVHDNHPLNKGLISWWLVLPNLSGGNTFYDLMGLNHGTLMSMTASNGWKYASRPGGYGELKFNGTDTYVNVGQVNVPNQITISVWTRIVHSMSLPHAHFHNLFGKRNDSLSNQANYQFDLNHNDQSNVRFAFSVGSVWYVWRSSDMGLTENWHFVTITYDAAEPPKFYKDGVLYTTILADENQGSGNPPLPTNTANTYIGWFENASLSNDDRPWPGGLDDIRVYNRALEGDEVGELYRESFTNYPTLLNRINSAYGAYLPNADLTSNSSIYAMPTVINHIASGGIVFNGCAGIQLTYKHYATYSIGNKLYDCKKARLGQMYPIVIRSIKLVNENKFLYVDTFHKVWNETDLCTCSEAKVLAQDHYSDLLNKLNTCPV